MSGYWAETRRTVLRDGVHPGVGDAYLEPAFPMIYKPVLRWVHPAPNPPDPTVVALLAHARRTSEAIAWMRLNAACTHA